MRKVLIGFISFGCVLAAYLLYTGLSNSPVIESDPEAEFIEAVADSNIGAFDSNVGKIGDIGIGTTKKAEYITLNEQTKEVERIWGFEELYKEDDLWRAKKPYVTVFEPEFTCYITADSGLMRLETAAERTTPKDGVFTGNVVIHVLPKESSDMKESFVYLDNVVFLSDRSQISTKGPVEYSSQDVYMQGKGLDVIYNDQGDRIEFFRIVHLEKLRIRDYQAMFAADEPQAGESAEVVALAEGEKLDEAEVAAVPEQTNETIIAAGPKKAESTPEAVAEPNDGVYYKCIVSKNVLVDTPKELIFADQRICISDIFWSKNSMRSDVNDVNDTGAVAAAGQAEPAGDPNSLAAVAAVDTGDSDVAVAAQAEPNAPSEESWDVEITCENGIVLVPIDSKRQLEEFTQPSAGSDSERPAEFEADTARTRFRAPRIDYNAVTGDVAADGESRLTLYSRDRDGADANEPPMPTKITARDSVNFFQAINQVVFKGDCRGSMPQKGLTEPKDVEFQSPEITVTLPEDKSKRADILAAGPVELTFYMQDANDVVAAKDPNSADTAKEPIPVTVTAQKRARFLEDLNQIVFEDDCNCMTIREDPNDFTEYMLLSELITVDLPEDTNDRSSGPAGGIEHLTASGGVVRLVVTKKAKTDPNLPEYVSDVNDAEILGGVEIKCAQVDFDPNQGLFKASGEPAEIWIDNSKVAVSEQDPNGFSLSGPCYAFLANYDSLKYFIKEDRIVAEAVPGGALWLHYVPVVDGVHDPDSMTTASAPHVEAFLAKTPDGRTELATMTATGGIDIKDLSNGNHFLGSKLDYYHETSIMKITGDDSRPCLCNGALVDEIEYNVTTGKLDFQVVGPGAMQINQQ